MTSEDVELAAKASGEVIAALADKSGLLAIPGEYGKYIATRIHLRHYPRLIESAMGAAAKIRALGLPQKAFEMLDEPLLTAMLEGMAEESDPSLQDMWQNLLANFAVEGGAAPRREFPDILKRLDPTDAHLLESWALAAPDDFHEWRFWRDGSYGSLFPEHRWSEAPPPGLNLSVLNLLSIGLVAESDDPDELYNPLMFTALGTALMRACRAPAG